MCKITMRALEKKKMKRNNINTEGRWQNEKKYKKNTK